ncbi:hypothetical protein AAE478_007321 [Parahypoxylon ruwenzoriense]
MLCNVCREGLGGIWDPNKSKRLGSLKDFPEILQLRFRDVDDDFNKVLNESELLEPEHYVFGHHVDYDSLLRSKQQGCVACKEFLDVNDRDDVNATFAKLGYYSVFCVGLSRAHFDQPAMLVYSGEMMEEFFHELVVHDGNKKKEKDCVNSMISPSTSDEKTWTLVQTWLDRCLKSHGLCQNRALAGFSPTRLLELVTMGTEKTFRLVQHGEFDPSERYVTLSHCWGTEPASKKLRLLVSTISDLRGGTPVAVLPRTFRHAFEIIERLHVRYIWIDRLCIIQDLEDDWRAESAVMQLVYRNGFLNIAALGASDDQGGCFFDRDPAQVGPSIINLNPSQDLPSHYRHVDETETWAPDFNMQPLITRAWVLQERMLAARNLYFGRQQVFWECFTANCCETIPTGPLLTWMPREEGGLDNTSSKLGGFAWKQLINPKSPNVREDRDAFQNLLFEWSSAVRAYCECSLTYSRDKLIALSGLANDMSIKLREINPKYDAYLAGIWKFTMPDSLLWTVKGPSPRPSRYRAPSWSWASVDGAVNLPVGGGNSSASLVRVLGAEASPRGKNAMGEVSGGRIVLEGPICVAKDLQLPKLSPVQHNIQKIRTLLHLETSLPIDVHLTMAEVRFDTSDDQDDEVHVLSFWSRPYPEFSEMVTHGLALVPVDPSRTLYRRVGYVSINIEFAVDGKRQDSRNPLLSACPVRAVEIV